VSILVQFVLRLSFGLALGMALTNPRQVTSGYYRVHLYVLLGLNVLATLAAFAQGDRLAPLLPLAAAILSYAGSVCWLYEKRRGGMVALGLIAAVSLGGAGQTTGWSRTADLATTSLRALDPLTSGLVLGLTMAAMFLGHWYLNSPTMAIEPLKRLVAMTGGAVCLRGVVEAAGLAMSLSTVTPDTQQVLFLSLRWLSGIFGALVLVVMAYRTLLIPNTQSATGILYVCVIATFLGELASLLLGVPPAAL
jgi:hypothetical protein